MRKLATLLVLALASTCSLMAATFNTVQDGDWNDPATWQDGIVPVMDNRASWPGNDVFINHAVTRTGTLTTTQRSSLTVVNGGSLQINGDLNVNNTSPATFLVEAGGYLTAQTLEIDGSAIDADLLGTVEVTTMELGYTQTPIVFGGTITITEDLLGINGNMRLLIDGATVNVGGDTYLRGSSRILIDGGAQTHLGNITQVGDADILGQGSGGILDFTTVSLENGSTIIQCVNNVCNYNGGNGGLPIEAIDLLTGARVLPVELLSFGGKVDGQSVELNWRTATESANDYYLLEYSRDGRNFAFLAQLKGAGYTEEAQYYSFPHQGLSGGTHYYRLWQYDYDGTYELLGTRHFAIEDSHINTGKLSVFPNPAPSGSTLKVSQGLTALHLYNSTGQLMAELSVAGETVQLPASLPAGIYYLRWQGNGQTLTSRLVVSEY